MTMVISILPLYQLYCSNSFFFHTLACFCFPRYQTRYSFRRDVQLVSIFLSHKGSWSFPSLKKKVTKKALFTVTDIIVFGYFKGTTIHHSGFYSSLSLLEKVYTEKGLVRVVHVTTRPNPSPQSWRKILRHWPLIKKRTV